MIPFTLLILLYFVIISFILMITLYYIVMQIGGSFNYGTNSTKTQGTFFDAVYSTICNSSTLKPSTTPESNLAKSVVILNAVILIAASSGLYMVPVYYFFPQLNK